MAAAQTPPAAKPTPTSQQIQKLIEKLGADQFQEREAASSALLDIGEPALLPLSTAERGKDAEVSSRAKAIRERIERERFEAISLRFKRDPDPTANYDLPGWKSFAKAAGTSRPAKRLFLEMLEQRHIIALCLESLAGGQVPDGVFDGLPADPENRLRTVVGKMCLEIRQGLLLEGKAPEAGDLITLLVVLQVLDDPPMETHEAARLLCTMGGLNRLMAMPGAIPSARKIMGAWFLKIPVHYGAEALNWANQHRIPEGRQMGLRMLDSKMEAEFKAIAMLGLSQFGTAEDLPVIEKYIDNAEMTDEFTPSNLPGEMRLDSQGPPNNGLPQRNLEPTYKQTLGDVALMAGAKISGLDLEKLFPAIRMSEMGIPRNSIGFPKARPELRVNAVKIYREYRAQPAPPAS